MLVCWISMELDTNSSILNSPAIIHYIEEVIQNHPDAYEFIFNSCSQMKQFCIWFETSKSYVLKTVDERFVLKIYFKEPGAVINEALICGDLATKRADLFPMVIGTYHNDKFGMIVSKHVGQDAFEVLSSSLHRASLLTMQLATGLLEAVDVLHQHEWTHRDIKLENIVYSDTDKKWRLIDFGLAVKKEMKTRPAGTPPLFLPHENVSIPITHSQRVDSDRYAAAMAILTFAGLIYPHSKFCETSIQNTKNNSICFVGGKCSRPLFYRINVEWLYNINNKKVILPSRIADHPKLLELMELSTSVVLAALYPFRFCKYLVWNFRTSKWETYGTQDRRSYSDSGDIHAAWQKLRHHISLK